MDNPIVQQPPAPLKHPWPGPLRKARVVCIGAVKDVAAAAAGTTMVVWLGAIAIVAVRVLEKLL